MHSYSQNNEPKESPDEVACPSGWKWKDAGWCVDTRLACDEEGWQYALDANPLTPSVSVQQMVHTHRRKRLVRVRVRLVPSGTALTVRSQLPHALLYSTTCVRVALRHDYGFFRSTVV